MTQSVTGSYDALYNVCVGLYAAQPHTVVSYGDPGNYQADLVVAMMAIRLPITAPTMGTGRSREKTAEIDILFSQFLNGGPEVQATAVQAVFAAADRLEAYFRTKPNEELSGNCRAAWVTDMQLAAPQIAYQPDDNGGHTPIGRIADLTVTVTAAVRI